LNLISPDESGTLFGSGEANGTISMQIITLLDDPCESFTHKPMFIGSSCRMIERHPIVWIFIHILMGKV